MKPYFHFSFFTTSSYFLTSSITTITSSPLSMAVSFPQKMFDFVTFPCINTKSLEESLEFKPTNHEINNSLVYRDDLDRNKTKRNNKRVTFSDDKTIESKSHDDEVVDKNNKEVLRVKVKMTKEQAARLLSKCKQGGVLEFKDVAKEIVQLPMNHVTIIESVSSEKRQSPVFKTIPEEVEI